MHMPITDAGQSGFQEGNGAQYTWMVPQDLRDLIRGMGASAAALSKLDTFFTQINAGQNKPYAWLGNEPTLGSPWVYLSAGAPWRAQEIVRESETTMFADTPQGLPGNDDLGTMSAWWIWCAMGLYPQNPSVRVLDIGSPLFRRVTVYAPGGPAIRITAPAAVDDAPYVQALRVNGTPTERTWIALPMSGTVSLDFDLGTAPNKTWGAAVQDAPPSFAPGTVAFPPSTTATLADAAPQVTVAPGGTTSYTFEIHNNGTSAQSIVWRAKAPQGVTFAPAQGSLSVTPGSTVPVNVRVHASSSLRGGLYDVPVDATGNGAPIQHLNAMVRVQNGNQTLRLGYIENRWDNSVTPIDPVSGAIGQDIKTGAEPRDAVLSADGTRLYVADRSAQAVTVIDTVKQTAITTVKVGHAPNGIAITPDGKTVWVANNDDGTIQSIDTATLKVSAPMTVGKNPRYIAIAPDGLMLYVTNEGSNSVTPLDLRTLTLLTPIPTGALPSGIAITPDGKKAYVADFGSNDVTPIDLVHGAALPAIPAGVSPVLVAMAPDGSVALVSNFATTTVTPIDIATDKPQPDIQVGGAPYGIAFTRDSQTAIVVIRRDNALVFLDLRTRRVGAPIRLGTSPYTIAM
jgi:YVTN family beta-propeller protein